MTIREAIDRADAIKPNTYTDEDKINWLSSLDGRIATEIMLMDPAQLNCNMTQYNKTMGHTYDPVFPEGTATAENTELLVNYPYDELYVYYLESKIDEFNQEYDSYANTYAIFNDMLQNFTVWFLQNFEPANGYV